MKVKLYANSNNRRKSPPPWKFFLDPRMRGTCIGNVYCFFWTVSQYVMIFCQWGDLNCFMVADYSLSITKIFMVRLNSPINTHNMKYYVNSREVFHKMICNCDIEIGFLKYICFAYIYFLDFFLNTDTQTW